MYRDPYSKMKWYIGPNRTMDYQDAINSLPAGFSLPTREDLEKLYRSARDNSHLQNIFINRFGDRWVDIMFWSRSQDDITEKYGALI